jgi:hypothetical protein
MHDNALNGGGSEELFRRQPLTQPTLLIAGFRVPARIPPPRAEMRKIALLSQQLAHHAKKRRIVSDTRACGPRKVLTWPIPQWLFPIDWVPTGFHLEHHR